MHHSPTRALARFVADLRYEEIPESIINHVKDCILDTIGCGLHGSTTPEGKLASRLALDWSSKPEATVWGLGQKTACPNAVLANSTMVESFGLDDIHLKATLHPGCVAVPTALALAERLGNVDGKQFLAAVTAGYETMIRVGMSIIPSARIRGFHPVSICAPFGSAAVAAKLLGMDEEKTLHALGTAAPMGAGLMSAQFDSMIQRLQAGRSAQSGLMGALLAREGFTGVKDVLEAHYGGFCSAFADDFDLDKVTDGLGEIFETGEMAIKVYAAAGSVQTAIEAIKALKREHGLLPEMVKRVTIKTNRAVYLHCGWKYEPQSVITAQMNISYGVAVIMLEGEAFVDQYTEAKIRDPLILEFIRKVQVVHDPQMDGLGQQFAYMVDVLVETEDGRNLKKSAQYPKGATENPISRSELIRKFSILASKAVSPGKAERIGEIVQDMEKERDIARLVQHLH